MPTYVYHCLVCEGTFKVRHGMKEACEESEWCGSANIKRVHSKGGDLVKGFIEDSRRELDQQKEGLKKER